MSVSVAELASLRSDFGITFTEDAEIVRTERERDNKGGWTNTDTVVWTGKVDRKPATETRSAVSEIPVGDRATALSYWLFTFPATTDVRAGDTIRSAGRTYQVAGPALDKALEIARYVVALEQQ